MSKPIHCAHCGAKHTDAGWPKRCPACERTTWKNPTPVAVALVPVEGAEEGILAIRRDIEPGKGKLALPGGYVDFGETWRAAIAREVREETDVVVDPEGVRVFEVLSPDDGGVVLIFGITRPVEHDALPPFQPRDETSERTVLRAPAEMAFPLHAQVVDAYFGAR
jgi:ADP-ribose pyrophosphatase YjhB (NUDIX family)